MQENIYQASMDFYVYLLSEAVMLISEQWVE